MQSCLNSDLEKLTIAPGWAGVWVWGRVLRIGSFVRWSLFVSLVCSFDLCVACSGFDPVDCADGAPLRKVGKFDFLHFFFDFLVVVELPNTTLHALLAYCDALYPLDFLRASPLCVDFVFRPSDEKLTFEFTFWLLPKVLQLHHRHQKPWHSWNNTTHNFRARQRMVLCCRIVVVASWSCTAVKRNRSSFDRGES